MNKAPLRLFYLIAVVWTVSVILDATWPSYEAPTSIHALMMLAAGWAFGRGALPTLAWPQVS